MTKLKDTFAGDPAPKELDDLEQLRMGVTKRYNLRVTALISLLIWAVGTTYLLVKFFETKPLETEVKNAKNEIISLKSDNLRLQNQISETRAAFERVKAQIEQPVLISPRDGASIIGSDITFQWTYRDHNDRARYILEVYDPRVSRLWQINVIHPERQRGYFNIRDDKIHELIWRIRPGRVVGNIISASGPWSASARFKTHPTIMARITEQRQIMVGTTPTSYGSFVRSDGQGNYEGFDVELIVWIGKRLPKELGVKGPIAVNIVEVEWKDLFDHLQMGEFDIAVRAITRSKNRERRYSNIRFSNEYYENRQYLITYTTLGIYPDNLHQRTVGVKKTSTNALVARELASEYDITVDASYDSYGDVYQALRSGKIDLAVVDFPLVADLLKKKEFQLASPALNTVLKDFYLAEFGEPTEYYAIALHEQPNDDRLRKAINRILAQTGTQDFLHALEKKYGLSSP